MALFKKKQAVSEEELQQNRREKTAQQWIPIRDIKDSIVYREDNKILGMLRVEPLNLELLSENEKKRKVDSLTEAFNGENEGFQIFCIGRPVDLHGYLSGLEQKAREELNFKKKMILKGYIQYASRIASSGETVERRFYIIISKEIGNKAEQDLLNRLSDLKMKLSTAELVSHICKYDELRDLFALFASPIQASFETSNDIVDLPSLMTN